MSGTRISVRAKPRAKVSAVGACTVGDEGLAVDVAIAAPPVDGAANDELVRILSKALRVPQRSVRVVAGASGKRKVVEIDGLDANEVSARLEAAAK